MSGRKLKKQEAVALVHEVACWMEYERATDGFLVRTPGFFGKRKPFHAVGHCLRGGCSIAAFVLVKALRARGYSAGSIQFENGHKGHAHWQVETACGWLLDPTWQQFPWNKGPLARRVRNRDGRRVGITFGLMFDPMPFDMLSPTWPAVHLATIHRILRRMGVET